MMRQRGGHLGSLCGVVRSMVALETLEVVHWKLLGDIMHGGRGVLVRSGAFLAADELQPRTSGYLLPAPAVDQTEQASSIERSR